MLKNAVFLFCFTLFCLSLNGQSNELIIEQLKTQISKAVQEEDRSKSLGLALLGYDYLAPNNDAFQRLLYEIYYSPFTGNEDYYEEEAVSEIAFNASDWSPDGKQIAVALNDGSIRLYTHPFAEYSEIFSAEEGNILDLDFSPNGQMLAFSNADGDMIMYSITNKKIIHSWEHIDYIRSLKWSHDGKKLAGGGDENIVFVYDVQSKKQFGKYESHSDWIRNISWSADDEMIAVASDDHSATVWSIKDGNLLKSHTDHSDYCRDVAFSPKGNSLVSCSDDLNIFHYKSAADDASDKNLSVYEEEWIMALDWSKDGKYIASAGNSGSIILFSTENDEKIYFNSVEPETAWMDIDFSPNSSHFAATSTSEITVYALGANEPSARLLLADQAGLVNKDDITLEAILNNKLPDAVQIFYSPDQSKIAFLDIDYKLEVIDAKTGHTLYSIFEHEDWIRSIAWSKDGQYLATASDDMIVGIWSAETGEPYHLLDGHTDWVRDVDFSPDNKTLLSVGDDGTLKAWDVETGEELSSTEESDSFLTYVSWSPNQTYIATQDTENFLNIRQASNNKLLFKSNGNTHIGSVKWVNDANLTALSTDGGLFSWNAKMGMSLSQDPITAVSSKMVSAKAKGPYISISGNGQSAFLQGHTKEIIDMKWSPGGEYLISFSIDDLMGIWEAAKGRLIALIPITRGETFTKEIIWLDDNNFLIAGSPKIILSALNIRQMIAEEGAELTFSKDDIITYNLEQILLTDKSIVAKIIASGNTNLLEAISAFYEERAQSRAPGAARTADENNAAKFKIKG